MSGSIQDSSESFYRRSLEIDFPIAVMSLCTARYAEVGGEGSLYRTRTLDWPFEDLFDGWAKQGLTDQEILSRGFECLDALYAQFKK
jgi:hypothetical protein